MKASNHDGTWTELSPEGQEAVREMRRLGTRERNAAKAQLRTKTDALRKELGLPSRWQDLSTALQAVGERMRASLAPLIQGSPTGHVKASEGTHKRSRSW